MQHMRWSVGIVLAGFLVGGQVSEASVRPQPILPMAWVIEAADYKGEVRDQIVRFDVRYTIRVIRDGWTEIPLALPGAMMTAIDLTKKTGDAHVAPHGGSYVLLANRKGAYQVHVKFSAPLVQDSQCEGLHLGIPQATFSTLSLFVPRKDVELRQHDQLYVERAPDGPRGGVTLVARLGASEQVDLRWGTKPASPVKVEPVLYGEVHTLATIEEQLVRLMSVIEYRIAQGDTKALVVHLPLEMNVLNVRGAGIDDWHVTEDTDHKTLTVALNVSLKESTYRLVVEGEQTIPDGNTEYALPEIQLTGVKQERGEFAVARAGNIELAPRTTEGMNRIDVKELPDLLKATGSAPAILAFTYHQHPYHVLLALTRHQDHAVLAAIAEQAELATVLSQQGELLTRATYLITANKKQYVGVVLPEGATLWSCLVNGKSVKPVEGEQRQLLVPLESSAGIVDNFSVEVVYFERRAPLTRIGQLHLQGPVLDVPTTISNWSVYAPQEIKFLRMSGNLEQGLAPFGFIEEPFIQTAFADTGANDGGDVMDRLGMFSHHRPMETGRLLRGRAVSSSESEFRDDKAQSIDSARTKASQVAGLDVLNSAMPIAQAPKKEESVESLMKDLNGRRQETGILPLKIRLPNAGRVYRFNRLMTTHDALRLDTTFVHVRIPRLPLAAIGLLLVLVVGLSVRRLRRR